MQFFPLSTELDAAWMVRDLNADPECTWMLLVASFETMSVPLMGYSELLQFLSRVREKHHAVMMKHRAHSAWAQASACLALAHMHRELAHSYFPGDDLFMLPKEELEQRLLEAVTHAYCCYSFGTSPSSFLWRYEPIKVRNYDLLKAWQLWVKGRVDDRLCRQWLSMEIFNGTARQTQGA